MAGGGSSFGDNGPATSAQLSYPTGIAVDSAGDLYIADTGNWRIRKVSGGVITTVAGNGTLGFSGDNGPATGASLSYPIGVAVDSAGNLYIADAGNGRIRKVSGGVIATVAGGGPSFGDNGPATAASLSLPIGVAVDSAEAGCAKLPFAASACSPANHRRKGEYGTHREECPTGGTGGSPQPERQHPVDVATIRARQFRA